MKFAINVPNFGDYAELEFATFGEEPDDWVRARKLDDGLEVLTQLWKGEREQILAGPPDP